MENPKKRNFRIVPKQCGKSEGEQDERLSEEPEKKFWKMPVRKKKPGEDTDERFYKKAG